MVSAIRIYVEGGGTRADTKTSIREGFGEFLRDLRALARSSRIGWYIVACGGREQTFDAFQIALATHPDAFNVLLVDAEGPVRGTPWQHLHQRDGWNQPAHAGDDQCQLMVQAMEAWLIADVPALRRFYGQGFNAKTLPRTSNVEQIDMHTLAIALENATRQTTSKGSYHKIKHGPKLLALVNAQTVRSAAPHCDRLFTTLLDRLSDHQP